MKRIFIFIFLTIAIITFFFGSRIKSVVDLNHSATTSPVFADHPINLADGTTFSLTAPQNYTITPAAQGMKRIRFMAWSPDSRLFVTDMFDLTDNSKGSIYILENFNKEKRQFASSTTYLTNLRNPNNVTFYKDNDGQQWIYIALTQALIRYKYENGDTRPRGVPEVVARFPATGLSYKYGGWHLTRTVAINNDKVYVSVGSSCNSCEEKEPERASIIQMDPDGKNPRFFAKGLRNAVGIKWVGSELFITNMGSDHLGADIPNEMFYKVQPGTNYGWPYCYAADGKVLEDTTTKWLRKNLTCAIVPAPDVEFPAHAAPLGLEYIEGFQDENLQNSFLVALHGSSDLKIGTGYKIVKVSRDTSEVKDFITGFLQKGTRYGRPVDIIQYDDSSFFFTDDFKGVVYFVSLK